MTNRRSGLAEAATLTAVLLAYSNGLGWWVQRRGKSQDSLFHTLNPAALVGMLFYAHRRHVHLGSLGIRRQGIGKSLVWGTILGVALSGPPLLFFYKPILLDTPLEYGPVRSMSQREMLQDVLVRVPVSIALLEELAFRGLLYTFLRRQISARSTIALTSLAFAGWHFTVTASSAAQTNIGEAARLPRFLKAYVKPLSVAGGMLATGLAGVGFGLLRERTDNLAGPALAHWIVDSTMICALWLKKPELKG
ncbi:MAG: CPBP family intramembrane metalloprotease [Chloroflexota bacterium]|nr:CPBP family intramembrane metalloprotease [Chloroflexota bacterium]